MHGRAFLEAIVAASPGSQHQMELISGLCLLGVADDVFRHGTGPRDRLIAARRHLADVERFSAASRRFRAIASALDAADGSQPRLIRLANHLIDYGADLHAESRFALAADVFAVVARGMANEPTTHMMALLRRGYALRSNAKLDDAEMVYHSLQSKAIDEGDTLMRLNAELGLAKIAIARDEITLAATILATVEEHAIVLDAVAILANARCTLAQVAGLQGEPERVVHYCSLALAGVTRDADKDIALVNLAFAERELQRPEMAAVFAEHVATTSVDAETRTVATTLLYHLAIDAKNRLKAARYRAQLMRATLSPLRMVEFYKARVIDAATNGAFIESHTIAQAVLYLAEHSGLTEEAKRARTAIEDLEAGKVPAVYAFRPRMVSEETARTIDIAEQRVTAMLRAVG